MIRVPLSQQIKHHLSGLIAATSGVALVEFALVLPVLVLLYLGSFQLMDTTAAYRKVTTATRAMADLATQSTSVTPTDVDAIMNASAQIMAPYKPQNGTFRISLINVDNAGVATVGWSRSKNGTALTVGSAYTLPASITINNVDVIVCDVTYNYQPVAFSSLVGAIPLSDRIFMLPRGEDTVAMTI